MEQKTAYIFEAIEKAEVSITDFSRMSSISRVSLYRWKNGGAVVDKLRRDLAYTLASRLDKACNEGKLPLADKMKADQRLQVLRKIVASMAAK